MSVIITQASSGDLETIQQTGRQTFSETFSASNDEEEMKRYLDASFATEKVQSELSNPDSLFFIAWEEDHPVGYLKLNSSTAQTELQDETALEIERIYVKNSHQGKKSDSCYITKPLTLPVSFRNLTSGSGSGKKTIKHSAFTVRTAFPSSGNMSSGSAARNRLIS